jgi:hypothetical protein
MHLPRTYPRLNGLAASGLLVGGVAARCAVGRRRLRRAGPAAGEVLQRWMLGSEARYRVLRTAGSSTVEVEVLAAPGLAPGTHLRLDAETARAARRQSA